MRVISNKSLVEFARRFPAASAPMQTWRKIVAANTFENFAELKSTFNATDRAKGFYIFDIGGNKFRIVAAIHFKGQRLYVRHVFTHAEYDKWNMS